jgi:hypothetical protein
MLEARRLLVELAEHAAVLARARVARIEGRDGLGTTHGRAARVQSKYRLRRLEAKERVRRGERFMGYAKATTRLRRAITKVAATGHLPVAIVREVFGDAASPLPAIATG